VIISLALVNQKSNVSLLNQREEYSLPALVG